MFNHTRYPARLPGRPVRRGGHPGPVPGKGFIEGAGVGVLLVVAIGPPPGVIIQRFGREVAAISG